MPITLKDRLPSLIEIREKHLIILEQNVLDPVKDKDGSASKSLAGTLRFLAVAFFSLKGDVCDFQAKMYKIGFLSRDLFLRAKTNEPIAPSYLSMLAYKDLFCALASGDMCLSQEIALLMVERDDFKKGVNHPFDRAFGYAIASVVLNRDVQNKYIEEFGSVCSKKENADFQGYFLGLRSIIELDSVAANKSLFEIIRGHKKQARGRGIFAGSEDEIICVWAVGVSKLMKSRGLTIDFECELLPQRLV